MVVGYVLFPTVYSIWISLNNFDLTSPKGMTFIGLSNYLRAFTDPDMVWTTGFTLLFVVCSIGLETLIGLGMALLLSVDLRGKGVIRALVILPIILPDVAVGYMFRLIYNYEAGPLNYLIQMVGLTPIHWMETASGAILAAIVTDVWEWTPLIALVLMAGMMAIPIEPRESAMVDGASNWQVFRFITLPMIKSVAVIIILLRTVDALRTMGMVHLLTGGGPGIATQTISIYTYYVGYKYFNYGYATAVAYVLVIISTVVGYLFLKAFRYEW